MGQKVDQTISRRGAERHAVSTFTCSLGMVVDFSRTGMRFCCDGKPAVAPGQRGSIQLAGPNTSMRRSWFTVRLPFRKGARFGDEYTSLHRSP